DVIQQFLHEGGAYAEVIVGIHQSKPQFCSNLVAPEITRVIPKKWIHILFLDILERQPILLCYDASPSDEEENTSFSSINCLRPKEYHDTWMNVADE
uniref:Uncharacterized protein n=1 Tax=Panagrolaimus sp. ES5 TaxID=591445 RepID=A0AC34GII6_9BILA